jgi:hypothetical protein
VTPTEKSNRDPDWAENFYDKSRGWTVGTLIYINVPLAMGIAIYVLRHEASHTLAGLLDTAPWPSDGTMKCGRPSYQPPAVTSVGCVISPLVVFRAVRGSSAQ